MQEGKPRRDFGGKLLANLKHGALVELLAPFLLRGIFGSKVIVQKGSPERLLFEDLEASPKKSRVLGLEQMSESTFDDLEFSFFGFTW